MFCNLLQPEKQDALPKLAQEFAGNSREVVECQLDRLGERNLNLGSRRDTFD